MSCDDLSVRAPATHPSVPDSVAPEAQQAPSGAPVSEGQGSSSADSAPLRVADTEREQVKVTRGPAGAVRGASLVGSPNAVTALRAATEEPAAQLGRGLDDIAPADWSQVRFADVGRTRKGVMFAELEDPAGNVLRVTLGRGELAAVWEPKAGEAGPVQLDELAAADLRMVLASTPRVDLDASQRSILDFLEGLLGEKAGQAPMVWPSRGQQAYEVWAGGPGAYAPPPEKKLGLIDRFKERIDGGPSRRLRKKVLADGRIELHEVWLLVNDVRDLGRITASERAALQALRDEHADKFDPVALAAMDRFLALADPNTRPRPMAPAEMRALWDESRKWPWNPDATVKPEVPPDPDQALAESLKIHRATLEEGYAMATTNAAFFDMYPSVAGRQFVAFLSGWAINETFDTHPLQAFDYAHSLPFGPDGKPKHALWEAYVNAVETGAPPAVVEEAYLRAHIYDYKRIVHHPDFKRLYLLAPTSYHKAVDAYLETLVEVEKQLDAGRDPVTVSKYFIVGVVGPLISRGTIGMVWHGPSFRNGLDATNPHTQIWWNGAWGMAGHVFLGIEPPYAEPTKVVAELSAAEAEELAAATGLPLKAGRNELTPEMFEGATFAEPERRVNPDGPPRRWPLRFEDFVEVQKLRPGLTVAGVDGVLQANEIRAILRNVQARVRSQLIDEFHAKYPVPIGGLLVYSANMLAMNQAYAEHEIYGMIPNFIMPVDNDGRPKGPLWEKYVQSYERHKATGAPSIQTLQRLWFEAHMEDFRALDGEEAQAQLVDFWNQAILDPTLSPLAIYMVAMVHGRDVFERARQNNLSIEQALRQSFLHVVNAVIDGKSFPFWKQDIQELGRWLFSARYRQMPTLDDRGLPTDKTLVARSLQGLRDLTGLGTLLVRPRRALVRQRAGLGSLPRADRLLSLAGALPPEELAEVDPRIVAFYEDPSQFRVRMRADFAMSAANEDREIVPVDPGPTPDAQDPAGGAPAPGEAPWWQLQGLRSFLVGAWGRVAGVLSRAALRSASAVSGIGNVPTGRDRPYEVEMEMFRDADGRTVWQRRFIDEDGVAYPIFDARFEVRDGKVVETFDVGGREVELVFDVTREGSGLRLQLDRAASSAWMRYSDITFVTQPDPSTGGLRTVGTYTGKGITSFIKGGVEFAIEPR